MSGRPEYWLDVLGAVLMLPFAAAGYIVGSVWNGFLAGWFMSQVMVSEYNLFSRFGK